MNKVKWLKDNSLVKITGGLTEDINGDLLLINGVYDVVNSNTGAIMGTVLYSFTRTYGDQFLLIDGKEAAVNIATHAGDNSAWELVLQETPPTPV